MGTGLGRDRLRIPTGSQSTSKGCFFAFIEKLKLTEFIKLGFAIYFQYMGTGRGRVRLRIPAGSPEGTRKCAFLILEGN